MVQLDGAILRILVFTVASIAKTLVNISDTSESINCRHLFKRLLVLLQIAIKARVSVDFRLTQLPHSLIDPPTAMYLPLPDNFRWLKIGTMGSPLIQRPHK